VLPREQTFPVNGNRDINANFIRAEGFNTPNANTYKETAYLALQGEVVDCRQFREAPIKSRR